MAYRPASAVFSSSVVCTGQPGKGRVRDTKLWLALRSRQTSRSELERRFAFLWLDVPSIEIHEEAGLCRPCAARYTLRRHPQSVSA